MQQFLSLSNVSATDFPKESAGRLMTTKIPVVLTNAMCGEIRNLLSSNSPDFDSINYVFVVDSKRILKGIISIKEVMRAKAQTFVHEAMTKEVATARLHTDQEHVVQLALKENIKMVPVVDKLHRFLGAVPSDVILTVMQQESQEDLFRFAGITHPMRRVDDVLKLSAFTSLAHRLPWLVLGLFGGLMAASIISRFEHILQGNVALAAFIPMIMYMGGATSAQMQAFVIRDLSINPKLSFTTYFVKQASVVLVMAIFLGALVAGLSAWLYSPEIASIISSALFLAMLSSVVTGVITPYLFGKLNLDPANTSGPIATMVQDILGVTIYFAIASLLL